MPDTPVSPLQTINQDITWIRSHAIIAVLTVALIAGGIIGGISLFESMIEKHDARVAAAQLKKEGVDTATQAAFMAQLNQEHADNVARDAAQTSLITSLIGKMAEQRSATAKQVATDATLDVQSAAARLMAQTKAGPGEITIGPNTVTMDPPVARTVVASLDLLPQAQNDVTNLESQLGAEKILTADAKIELEKSANVIAADKVELIATVKADNDACKVRVDAQAAKDRKRGFWFSLLAAAFGGLVGHSL